MSNHTNKTTKTLDFEVTAISFTKDASSECIVEGYANTSSKDRVGDIVLPSAFEKSLPGYMENSIMLYQHNWDDVAGKILEAKIVDKGLYVKGRISDTRQDLKTLVREGCLKTFSIGYNELDADFDEATKTKIVKELELLEISIVSIPANPEAKFSVIDVAKAPEAAPLAPIAAAPAEAQKSYTVHTFITDVKEACISDLDSESLIAITDFYNNEKDNLMKLNKKELIEALRATVKSLEVVAPAAPEAAKADPAAPAPEAQAPQDPMKEIMAKLDMIAQACASLLDAAKADAQEEQPAPEAPKPAEAPKAPEPPAKEAGPSDEQKDFSNLSDEELDALEAEINANLEELE